jgi:hypothetical protein
MSLPSFSGQPAPVVAGECLWTLDRILQETTPAEGEQKWQLNSNFIQYTRWCFECPFGCPTVDRVPISMKLTWNQIIQSIQVGDPSKGCAHGIQADGRKVAWSWRAFVAAMQPADAERVVGPGLIGISMCPRLGTFDHHRAQVAKSFGEDLSACEGRPPIWDFEFYRSDGTFVLVHPRPGDRWRWLDFATLTECQHVHILSPSAPLHQVRPTVEAQPALVSSGDHVALAPWMPPSPARPQVASAPPARPQAVVTTAKAVVPATVHVPAQQADHAMAAVLCSKAEAYTRLRAVPLIVRPDWRWWDDDWWSPYQGEWGTQWCCRLDAALESTRKALATAAKAAVPTSNGMVCRMEVQAATIADSAQPRESKWWLQTHMCWVDMSTLHNDVPPCSERGFDVVRTSIPGGERNLLVVEPGETLGTQCSLKDGVTSVMMWQATAPDVQISRWWVETHMGWCIEKRGPLPDPSEFVATRLDFEEALACEEDGFFQILSQRIVIAAGSQFGVCLAGWTMVPLVMFWGPCSPPRKAIGFCCKCQQPDWMSELELCRIRGRDGHRLCNHRAECNVVPPSTGPAFANQPRR